jgi:hypothetical protein
MVRIPKKLQLSIGIGVATLAAGFAIFMFTKNDGVQIDTADGAPTSGSETRYPWHSVIGTVFWVGEDETSDNGFINNRETAWDLKATETFGGVDDPEKRADNGVRPAAFEPKHNTFYMALPATEFNRSGLVKEAREKSYWGTETADVKTSLFKGRWAEVYYQGKTAYVQWVDVGPFEEYDYDYVFGHNKPKNKFGKAAGIDLSPAAEAHLGFDGVASVFWRFVDAPNVPDGPWRTYPAITNTTNW